jgi:hypothetical protein
MVPAPYFVTPKDIDMPTTSQEQSDTVIALLVSRADVNIEDSRRGTALKLAKYYRYKAIVQLLKEAEAKKKGGFYAKEIHHNLTYLFVCIAWMC